jgi:hypothetical protein
MITVFIFTLSLPLTACLQDSTSSLTESTIGSAVRSSNDMIIALLRDGVRNSPTLTRLIETLEQTDGIIYVEPGACRRGIEKLRACLTNEVVAAGGRRYLRVLVDIRKDPVDVTGSIGHELQHAVEVLRDRSVTSTASLFAFYQSEGRNSARSYETEAAVDAGLTVAREVGGHRRNMASRH